jgi:hypothetical protein
LATVVRGKPWKLKDQISHAFEAARFIFSFGKRSVMGRLLDPFSDERAR